VRGNEFLILEGLNDTTMQRARSTLF